MQRTPHLWEACSQEEKGRDELSIPGGPINDCVPRKGEEPGVHCGEDLPQPGVMESEICFHINKKCFKKVKYRNHKERIQAIGSSSNRRSLTKMRSSEKKLQKSQSDKTKEEILN